MSHPEGAGIAYQGLPLATIPPLRPALASIRGACQYLGEPSRAKFYADLLPQLDVVKFGARTFVTVESLDRLIAANRRPATKEAGELPTPKTSGTITVSRRPSDKTPRGTRGRLAGNRANPKASMSLSTRDRQSGRDRAEPTSQLGGNGDLATSAARTVRRALRPAKKASGN
jgi:hypothetical protein